MTMINLADLTDGGRVHNLAGKERGESARRQLRLDELDHNEGLVRVTVPNWLYNISSSFFLGMFSPSLRQYQSREEFLKKYNFDASPMIMSQVLKAIDKGLMQRGPLSPERRSLFGTAR